MQVPLRLLYLNYLLSALLFAQGSGGARRMAQLAWERLTWPLSEEGRRERAGAAALTAASFFMRAAPFRSASAACPEQRADRLHSAAFGMHEHCCSHAGGCFLKEDRWLQPRRSPSPALCPRRAGPALRHRGRGRDARGMPAPRRAVSAVGAVRSAAHLPVGFVEGHESDRCSPATQLDHPEAVPCRLPPLRPTS